ncbi:hypothetical protein NP233_g1056 [Leucocoprinus birnbaumii]|uniref:G domain-containing protein n=1 Tax=Leucocoprinus birnbaumii TaxID=56174 RepID=A0AAD5W392_9AGAR|nr:hypothetical protein NP233_g1056 [Leucocoprinus birnbaumii]
MTYADDHFFERVSVAGEARNIVIFGETGAGKSSIIRMLSDSNESQIIPVSNRAVGCTPQSTPYLITIGDNQYTIWDTAGLSEGEAGTVPADVALNHLRDLAQNLNTKGISLLLYCIRWSRYRKILKINFDLFSKIICGGKIPIVAVITGLESEQSMGAWWELNKDEFQRRGMKFDGHACITATKGKENRYEAEYEESIQVMKKLILEKCKGHTWKIRSKSRDLWLQHVSLAIARYGEYNSSKDSPGDWAQTLNSIREKIVRVACKTYRIIAGAINPPVINSPTPSVDPLPPVPSAHPLPPVPSVDPLPLSDTQQPVTAASYSDSEICHNNQASGHEARSSTQVLMSISGVEVYDYAPISFPQRQPWALRIPNLRPQASQSKPNPQQASCENTSHKEEPDYTPESVARWHASPDETESKQRKQIDILPLAMKNSARRKNRSMLGKDLKVFLKPEERCKARKQCGNVAFDFEGGPPTYQESDKSSVKSERTSSSQLKSVAEKYQEDPEHDVKASAFAAKKRGVELTNRDHKLV